MLSHTVLPHIGISEAELVQCLEDSGGFDNRTNTLMEAEVDRREQLMIVNLPTVTVNGQIERGEMMT